MIHASAHDSEPLQHPLRKCALGPPSPILMLQMIDRGEDEGESVPKIAEELFHLHRLPISKPAAHVKNKKRQFEKQIHFRPPVRRRDPKNRRGFLPTIRFHGDLRHREHGPLERRLRRRMKTKQSKDNKWRQ